MDIVRPDTSEGLAAEPPEPLDADAPSVEATKWSFCGAPITVFFLPGGHASISGHGLSCDSDRSVWSQDRNHVTFDCNHYTAYDLRVDGDRMTGRWHRTGNPEIRVGACLQRTRP